MEKNEKAFVVNALRRASVRWPARTETKQAARVSRGNYLCAGCGEIVRAKEISVDHIEPVISPSEGFTDWNTFVARLFCSKENLQCLCADCHKEKSKQENQQRKPRRPRKKAKTKKAGPLS
jgi:5-methylcytosine-specific restriction endonuclease McrA